MCPPVCLHTAIVNPNVQPSRPAVERSGAVARHATRVKKQRPDSGRPLPVEKWPPDVGRHFLRKYPRPDLGRHFQREKPLSRVGARSPGGGKSVS